MRELLVSIVRQLVDNPDEVLVKEIKGGNITVLEIRVAKKDLGKIIGKSGQTANAIRTLLLAVSTARLKQRCIIEILD